VSSSQAHEKRQSSSKPFKAKQTKQNSWSQRSLMLTRCSYGSLDVPILLQSIDIKVLRELLEFFNFYLTKHHSYLLFT